MSSAYLVNILISLIRPYFRYTGYFLPILFYDTTKWVSAANNDKPVCGCEIKNPNPKQSITQRTMGKKKQHSGAKRKKLRRAKVVATEADTDAFDEAFTPRIRVSFEGVISWVESSEAALTECPIDAGRRKDGIRTFRQQGMTMQQLLVSGLWPGGSRDLSSVTPRRFYPHYSDTAIGKYDLAVPRGCDREWAKGSVQELATNDALARIKSLEVSEDYREARDASYCNQIRLRSARRGMVSGVNYCGDMENMIYECKQMQHSYWALFYGRLWHAINNLGISSSDAYPAALGFHWDVTINSGMSTVRMSDKRISKSCMEARREILMVAAFLADLMRVVMRCTPCALKPWQGLNTHFADMQQMRAMMDKGESIGWGGVGCRLGLTY